MAETLHGSTPQKIKNNKILENNEPLKPSQDIHDCHCKI